MKTSFWVQVKTDKRSFTHCADQKGLGTTRAVFVINRRQDIFTQEKHSPKSQKDVRNDFSLSVLEERVFFFQPLCPERTVFLHEA